MEYQLTNGNTSQLKYKLISESIRNSIRNKTWPAGSKIPSCRILSKTFNVTVSTVCKALDELCRSGELRAVQGSGTYVTAQAERIQGQMDLGLISQTSGDLFGSIFEAFSRLLPEYDFHVAHSLGPGECSIKRGQLERLIKKDLDALLVDGDAFVPFDRILYNQNSIRTLTIFNRNETLIRIPGANYILTDYEAIGRLMVNRLLSRGGKRFIFRTFQFAGIAGKAEPIGPSWAYHWPLLRGCELALKEAKMKPSEALFVVSGDSQEMKRRLALLVEQVDGAICVGDFWAKEIYALAKDAGRSIGKEFFVVGLFNTPWGDALSPSLTSVSIEELRMAELAVETIRKSSSGVENMIVPRLVERESA